MSVDVAIVGILGNLLPLTQPSVQFTENETLMAQQKITSGLPVIRE